MKQSMEEVKDEGMPAVPGGRPLGEGMVRRPRGRFRKGMSDSDGDSPEMVRVTWQVPLYLSCLLLLGAGGTACLDALGGGSRPRKIAHALG